MSVNEPSLVSYAQALGETQSKPAGYLEAYERAFSHLRYSDVRLLELGVADGKSMKMWRDYFANGQIVGLDLFPPTLSEDRVTLYQGAQDNLELLTKIAETHASNGFDIIIDDAAHIGQLAKESLWHLFVHHLKPGGFYVLEDWGTGYWKGHRYYPDGRRYEPRKADGHALNRLARSMLRKAPVEWPKLNPIQKLLRPYQYASRLKSHDAGLVGLIKQLIDQIGMSDALHPEFGISPDALHNRHLPVASITVLSGVAILQKQSA